MPEAQRAERIYRVNASALNLRDQPRRDARALTLLPYRQAVARLDETDWDGWWWVFADIAGHGVFDGYAYSEYLEPITAPEVVAEPAPAPAPAPQDPVPETPAAPAAESLAGNVIYRANGTIKPLGVRQLWDAFGKFDYTPDERTKGKIKILGVWEAENIVDCQIPALEHIGHGVIKLHKKAVGPFQRAFARIHEAGLSELILNCAGTHVARHKGWDPERALSSHSWGIAIDINTYWNGYGVKPAEAGAHGSVRQFVPFFAAEGIAWGGHFSSPYEDGMHFELARIDV